jgi:hypothetical protein
MQSYSDGGGGAMPGLLFVTCHRKLLVSLGRPLIYVTFLLSHIGELWTWVAHVVVE